MCVDLQGLQQTLFSCNGIRKEPEFDETCRQQNLVGLSTNVYYCYEFNCFALTYARFAYGPGNSFQGSPPELKKWGRAGKGPKGSIRERDTFKIGQKSLIVSTF